MIPQSLMETLPELLPIEGRQPVRITNVKSLGGGCINSACRIDTDVNSYFIKWNRADAFPGMFESEAKGLKLLADTNTLRVPLVVHCGLSEGLTFLILEYLTDGSKAYSFWQDFGSGLAALHSCHAETFGLDYPNYIGSLQQHNRQSDKWPDFFMRQRLEVQTRQAFDSGLLGTADLKAMDRLYISLPSIFPEEKPSLLHGDLWSGNFMTGPKGEPCIIDPAVYYGHREMDLGMSLLFGGFDHEFYLSYHERFPLEKSWRQRVDICNLYPLLVHVNLFGGGYVGQVRGILRKFA